MAQELVAKKLNEQDLHHIQRLTKLGLVVMPTIKKGPRFKGWQSLKQTLDLDDYAWQQATGFGIQCGKVSGITVVDVDKPAMEFFEKFWAHHKFPPTTTVKTPSGGLHLYYKYHPDLKQTQGFAGLDIDIRNDGGQVVAPGARYDTDKKDKMRYIGVPYEFAYDDDGKKLDFSRMLPLDRFWVEMQDRGVNSETYELNDEKPAAEVVCCFD